MSDTPPPADGWRQGPDGKWYGPGDEAPTGPVGPQSSASPTSGAASGQDTGEPADEATRRGSRRVAVIAAAVIAVAAFGVAVIATSGSDNPTLSGEFTLSSTDSVSGTAESCRGTGGYSDFGPGMNVTIRNGSGEIIASSNTSSLDPETYFDSDESGDEEAVTDDDEDMSPEDLAETMFDVFGCTVVFDVEIPDSDFYEIEVGRRGELSYSREELEDRDWQVSLTLGD